MRAVTLLSSLAILATTSIAVVACSSTPAAEEPFVGAGAACKSVLAGQCGQDCTTDDTCPSGQYCNLGSKCSADCAQGQACGAGQTCDERGRCAADPAWAEAGVGDAVAADACPNVTVAFEKTIPTVVLLVDQSGSMEEDFGGDTRWNVARKALVDPTSGVVKVLERDVRFGLALYTSKDGSAGGKCPLLTEVNVAMNNFTAIKAAYDKADPVDETPTGESITAVANKLADPKIPGPKYIVLATDGEPDTCAEPNPQNGQAESIKAAQAAFGKGIKTFVISVGEGTVSAKHLQELANAGQGLAPAGATKAKYYVASGAASLKSAFDSIIYGVRSCTFKLNAKVTDPEAGTVTLDGAKLGYGDPNGWKLSSDGTHVELVGDACTKIKTGDHSISASFACGAVIK